MGGGRLGRGAREDTEAPVGKGSQTLWEQHGLEGGSGVGGVDWEV